MQNSDRIIAQIVKPKQLLRGPGLTIKSCEVPKLHFRLDLIDHRSSSFLIVVTIIQWLFDNDGELFE